jgi:hypothetical protein
VLRRIDPLMKSNYDRRLVLQQIASRVVLDRAGAAAYVRAMSAMTSDYDQREALTALTTHNAAAVDGDTLLPALSHMHSSYDKRMVLEQILASGPLSPGAKHTVLAAAADMSSDYDRREVLTAFLNRFGLEPALRTPFFVAVRAIRSNYDRREVLIGLARKGSAGPDVQDAVFDAVAEMTSDYDRAEVLLAFASRVDAASRRAFVAAAEGIRSSHDQNRVLAALEKSERR